jgi:hypothetical protein
MRLILALLLSLPAFAQTPPAAPKPEEKAAQAQAPAETPKAEDKSASPAPATESWIDGYVDFGYRWVTDVRGNFQQYRSVVNLGEGPKLFDFDLTLQDPKKRFYDTLILRGMGWGGDPYNTASVSARKMKLYDFRFDYKNIAYFNAVPSYANPVAPAGFDERSFDTRRREASFQLDLFPGSRIIPYLAYDRNSGHGRGIETWVLGATNEFPIPYTLRDKTDSYRGGVRFELNRFHLTLEQGGTTFKEDDGTNYTGPNPGDRTTPANGVLLSLNTLQQAYGIRGTSLYSRILMTARPTSFLNVYGQFLYSVPRNDVSYSELATGKFVDFASGLPFAGQYGVASGNAVQPHISGNLGAEFHWNRLHIIESLTTDREHDSAFSLFSPVLFQSLSPAVPLSTSSTSIAPRQVVRYNQSQTDLLYDVTSRLTLRAGYRYLRGDATVLAGSLSQIGPSLAGELNRHVLLGGLTFRPSTRFSFNGDYEGSSSDRVYFRTSLNEYSKARIRAKWQATASLLVQANFRILDNQNPAPDIRYDFRSRDNSLALFWTPAGGKHVSFMGEYDRSTTNSDIRYLDLPFLTPTTSSYDDRAHTATAAADFMLPAIKGAKLTAGGSLFISSGSRPTRYYQPLARLSLPLYKHIVWNTDWQYYGFGEQFYLFEGFRTHIFMTGLRLTR